MQLSPSSYGVSSLSTQCVLCPLDNKPFTVHTQALARSLLRRVLAAPGGGGPSLQGVPRPEQAGLKRSRGPQRGAGLRQNVPGTQERGQATRYLLHVELSSGPACGEPHSPRITRWVGSECSTLPELKDSTCNLPIEC